MSAVRRVAPSPPVDDNKLSEGELGAQYARGAVSRQALERLSLVDLARDARERWAPAARPHAPAFVDAALRVFDSAARDEATRRRR